MRIADFFDKDWNVRWDVIGKIPNFELLMTTKQSTVWHKEGNCFTHSQLVTEEMEKILEANGIAKGTDEWQMCMAAAICHDLGKGVSTFWSKEKENWSAKNHGATGERITRRLLSDEDIVKRERVCYMIRHHMTLHHIFDDFNSTYNKLIRLSEGLVPVSYMLMLKDADSKGSRNDFETEELITKMHDRIKEEADRLCCFDKPYTFRDKTSLICERLQYMYEPPSGDSEFNVYILCGFPGSGKSTYIQKYMKEEKVVSRDIIRGRLGIGGATPENGKKVVGTREEEDRVTIEFDKEMAAYCKAKQDFVIDNINLRKKYRDETVKKLLKYNPRIIIIYVEAPNYIDDCIKRRLGEIDPSVFGKMEVNFDFPQMSDCHELFFYKEKENGADSLIKVEPMTRQ